jgi:hypothetical protein
MRVTILSSGPSRVPSAVKFNPLALVVAAFLFALWPARAATPEDEYLKIFDQIQQADSLSANGQADSALIKYRDAQTALLNFRKTYRDVLVTTVNFRLSYVADKIGALTAKSAPGETNAVAARASGQVKLLEAGAEPHKTLRLHPAPGDKQSVVLTTKTDTEMTLPGTPSQAVKMPALKLTLDLTVKSVSAEGNIAYELAYTDATLAEDADTVPQMAELMKAAVANLKGISGAGTMSSRGLSQTLQTTRLPADAEPLTRQTVEQMDQSFANLGAPFPEEPVGPGARWQVQMPVKMQGMTIEQTITCQLVSIEDDRVTLKNTVTQKAANQKMQNAAMPGLNFDLAKMTGSGTVQIAFNLAQVFPSELTGDSHADLTLVMDMAGQKQSVTMKTSSSVKLQAK